MAQEIRHIAVIRLSAMGDVAMTVPVLRAFANAYPGVKVTMISRGFFKPFFSDIPNLEFVEFDANGRHKGFFGILRLFSDVKKRDIDAFADLHNVLRTKIISALFALSGTKTATIDKARKEKKALTRTNNKIFKQLPLITDRHAKVFAELGFPVDLNTPDFPEPQILTTKISSITGDKSSLKWIGIAPFAQYESKVYPQDLMKKVIGLLAQSPNHKLFLFGGSQENSALEQLAGNSNNIVIIPGKLTFADELALISNLDLMLSMDSGNAHIAAMYRIKVVTLWGATHPFSGFSPFNQPFDNALTSDRKKYPLIPTSVYGNKIVEGYEDAMRTISAEAVANKVKSLLH